MGSLKVFLSYSHDSKEHENWVLKLATNLRSHGVDAILDQWDLRLGSDLRFFMEQGLSASALVLCVCSEKYVEKVNSGVGGAGYEGMLISQDLLRKADSEYIIPIVRNNQANQKMPRMLGTKYYIDFSDDSLYYDKYQELLERIHGEDINKKPPLGANPFGKSMSEIIRTKTQMDEILYHSPEFDGHVVFRYDNHNGVYQIGSGKYAFDTKWSGCATNCIYSYGKVGYHPTISDFPSFDRIIDFDFSSRTRRAEKGQVIILENTFGHFAAIKVGSVQSRSHGAEYDELEFDYHIYLAE